MATSQNTSRPATVTRLHVQQSVASGRRGTDGGLDRAGVPRGRAPDTLPRGSETQFPPRMTDDGRDAPCGQWVGGALLSSRGFYWRGSRHGGCFLPMHVTVPLVHSATCRVPVRHGAGTAGRTQPGPCPPVNENGREAWAGPRPPCPHGSWAQTGGASRRLRETLLAGDPGPPSATGPQVPAIPLWAKARSRPGNTECVPRRGLDWPLSSPLSPLGSGGRRPAWLGPSLG